MLFHGLHAVNSVGHAQCGVRHKMRPCVPVCVCCTYVRLKTTYRTWCGIAKRFTVKGQRKKRKRYYDFVYVCNFYRAMHFSAKRGIAIACRLSVRLSVRL